jgi:hypothetical protein
MAPDDHRCPWRDEAERLAALVVELQAALNRLGQEVAQLRRQVVGPKTEKIPPPESELDDGRQPRDSDAAQRKRRERAEQRAATIETEHHKCSVPVSVRPTAFVTTGGHVRYRQAHGCSRQVVAAGRRVEA